MDIEKFISNIESLDINAIINEAIKQNEKKILKLNTDAQLFKAGISGTGARLTPKYRPSTVARKKRKGQPYDRVTLRDTGHFHSAFFIVYEKEQITITTGTVSSSRSANLKEILMKRYGKELFGLTQLDIDLLREIIEPTIIKLINQCYGT